MIYPNPSADEITITWPLNIEGKDISIYSVAGIHVASSVPQTKSPQWISLPSCPATTWFKLNL